MNFRIKKIFIPIARILLLFMGYNSAFCQEKTEQGEEGDCTNTRSKVPGIEISEKIAPVYSDTIVAIDGVENPISYRIPPGEGSFPAILFFHGGTGHSNLESTIRNVLTGATQTRFLQKGFVIVHTTRREMIFTDKPKDDTYTGGVVYDGVAAVEFVRKIAKVDPEKVIIYGGSAGGSLGFEVAAREKIAALIVGEPASHAFMGLLSENKNISKKKLQENYQKYYTPHIKKHTRTILSKISCPVLILHGGSEPGLWQVNKPIIFSELKNLGKIVEFKEYPGLYHGFYWGSGGRNNMNGEELDIIINDSYHFIVENLNIKTEPIRLTE